MSRSTEAGVFHKFLGAVRAISSIRCALRPKIDVATEPRWARVSGTMGEDAHLTAKLAVAYIKGFFGGEFELQSVTTALKQFPGAGPVQHGEDSHFMYRKNTTRRREKFEHHLARFKAAIAARTRQIILNYSRLIEIKYESVAAGSSKDIGFSDCGLVTDFVIAGQDMPAHVWSIGN